MSVSLQPLGEQHSFYLFLFSDILLLTKKKSGEFKLKQQYSLKRAVIQTHEIPKESFDVNLGSKTLKRKSLGRPGKVFDYKNVIEVLLGDGGTLSLFPETPEEKEEWRNHLENVTAKLYSKRG